MPNKSNDRAIFFDILLWRRESKSESGWGDQTSYKENAPSIWKQKWSWKLSRRPYMLYEEMVRKGWKWWEGNLPWQES